MFCSFSFLFSGSIVCACVCVKVDACAWGVGEGFVSADSDLRKHAFFQTLLFK